MFKIEAMETLRDYLTVSSFAKLAGICPKTVRKMIQAKRIKAFLFAKHYAIPRRELYQYLRKSRAWSKLIAERYVATNTYTSSPINLNTRMNLYWASNLSGPMNVPFGHH